MHEGNTGLRSSGVYGLFQLDGAPVNAADAAEMGMPAPGGSGSWLFEGVDMHAPHAVFRHEDSKGALLVVGEIEDAENLAQRLALPPNSTLPAIAHHAFRHFGPDLPGQMIGEWSLAHRDSGGTVTLMISAARRDRMLYAVRGNRVAVAPNLLALSRLSWIGDSIDEAVLLSRVGQSDIRSAFGTRTMLARVDQLEPGASITVRPDGRSELRKADILTPQPRWQGSFDDAIAETEALMRRIMRQRLARTARAAPLVSGGLDSSFLAWLIREENVAGVDPLLICSVAPPDSGISDEMAYAQIVAEHIGLPIVGVFPEAQANTYRPIDAIMAGANGPPLSNRHCLTEAFQIAAKAAGADLLVNGSYGEATITKRLFAPTFRQRLKAIAGNLRRKSDSGGANAFHVRLSPHRMAMLPDAMKTLGESQHFQRREPRNGELCGYLPGIEKAMQHPNEFYPGALRMDFPFRDARLLRLFASFPVEMLMQEGADRPVVRKMLTNRLPDSIRLRRRGMPASPDHHSRLQRQATDAQQRIAIFRKADVDEWVDLDWLHGALGAVGANGVQSVDQANEVQLTTMFAEYLTWWRTRA